MFLSWIHIFDQWEYFMPFCPCAFLRQLWKGEVTFFHYLPHRLFRQDRPVLSPSSHFLTNMIEHTFSLFASSLLAARTDQPTWERKFPFSLSLSLSLSSTQAFWAGQTCPVFLSLHFLVAGRTSQHERPHSLFFTDSLSHISSSTLSTMRRTHPIYGPLVSGKSFFHHSSFFLNQQILGETNWIFSTLVLTSAF